MSWSEARAEYQGRPRRGCRPWEEEKKREGRMAMEGFVVGWLETRVK